MSKFSKKDLTLVPTGIGKYPDQCSVFGCEFKTDIVFVLAHQQATGKTVCGNYAELRNNEYSMQPGYIFRAWITRCCACYMRDLIKLGKDSKTCATNNRLERERIFSEPG
jgi:hypothetical protein